jgi:hypothetical protein
MLSSQLEPIEFPELIFATAGPIGVDMDLICRTLAGCLRQVDYKSEHIKLSSEMESVAGTAGDKPSDSPSLYHWKIDYANSLRRKFQLADVLARIALERFPLFVNRGDSQ